MRAFCPPIPALERVPDLGEASGLAHINCVCGGGILWPLGQGWWEQGRERTGPPASDHQGKEDITGSTWGSTIVLAREDKKSKALPTARRQKLSPPCMEALPGSQLPDYCPSSQLPSSHGPYFSHPTHPRPFQRFFQRSLLPSHCYSEIYFLNGDRMR